MGNELEELRHINNAQKEENDALTKELRRVRIQNSKLRSELVKLTQGSFNFEGIDSTTGKLG